MLRISLRNPSRHWVSACLTDNGIELEVSGWDFPDDVIRDFVDAVQSLQSTDQADCCWFQDRGEMHWNLRRTGKDIEVEILEFPEVDFPGKHRGDAISVFKSRTEWVTFARQLLSSLESIQTDMGRDGYERAWRHSFPTEAHEKLRRAIKNEKVSPSS